MTTTLNKIKEHHPCTNEWKTLLESLGKTKADDEPLSLISILKSNGIKDAIWCLRALEGKDREIRLFAVACVREVEYLMEDTRSVDAINVSERYANGKSTQAELATARAAARDAASDAALVDEASAAAWSAAYAAPWAAARDEAVASASFIAAATATWAVTRDEASDAAKTATWERQKELFIKFFGKKDY